jgi:hypothetical protein
LRKGRRIYVRKPAQDEKNANLILIEKGAAAVDFNGAELIKSSAEALSVVEEPAEIESLEAKVRSACNGRPLSAKELLAKLNLDWSTQKLTSFLKNLEYIEVVKEKNKNFYKLKSLTATKQASLFL